MIVGIPKETFPGERRVALVPALVAPLAKARLEVALQAGAGVAAGYPDAAYEEKGVRIVASREELFRGADVVIQVRGLGSNREAGRADLPLLRRGQAVVAFLDPLGAPEAARDLAATGCSAFAMELMPRITRAQSMDALSSMATVAGYKAVLLAAERLPKMFPMLMTAAGTVSPARVFVVGAGVAGLQAISVARRLGAVVQAYDVRLAVKEQVESLGAKFVELGLESAEAEDKGGYAKARDEAFYERQREVMARVVAESDVVITTAQVPGKRAPLLVTEAMLDGMAPGSVVVDLAAEQGGNCEATRAGEVVERKGVAVVGPLNLPGSVPFHASQMYAKNAVTFLLHLVKDGKLDLERDDEILKATLVASGGKLRSSAVLGALADAGARKEA